MDDFSLSAISIALLVVLIGSAFFSMAETSLMSLNRYRLRHLAAHGHRGAQLATQLLEKTEQLLGSLLLGNNLLNALAAVLVTKLTERWLGNNNLALLLGTCAVTFAILVFAEITPKVIGATYADRLGPNLSYVLHPIKILLSPVVWFINLFVKGLQKLLFLRTNTPLSTALSLAEIRMLVQESSRLIPIQYQRMLLNLVDLDDITVEDIMTPRAKIEGINLEQPLKDTLHQITTSHHTRIPVWQHDLQNILGLLHIRRLLDLLNNNELTYDAIVERLSEPIYVPARTPVLSLLTQFQTQRQRCALVIDEYGDIIGLITLEDILEEVTGKFTTNPSSIDHPLSWSPEGVVTIDGTTSLRDINKQLDLTFPIDGQKTLSGLIIERLQGFPEGEVSLRLGGCIVETIHTGDRLIRQLRLTRDTALSLHSL